MNYVYLHGFCSSANSFKGSRFREKMVDNGLTLHTPDLNGDNFEELTITSQLAIVRQLIDSIPGEITLMGSSMGGYLAALFAQQESRVRQLVLLAPAFQFAQRYLERLEPAVLERWQRKRYIELYHYGFKDIRRLHIGILDDAQQYDSLVLDRNLPTLIMHGIHDDTVPYQLSVDYVANHPESRLLLLPSNHQLTDTIDLLWDSAAHFLRI